MNHLSETAHHRRPRQIVQLATPMLLVVIFICVVAVLFSPFVFYGYYIWKNTEREEELRARLEAADGLPRLKAWASERIGKYGFDDDNDHYPASLKDLRVVYVHPHEGMPLMTPRVLAPGVIGMLGSPSQVAWLSTVNTLIAGSAQKINFLTIAFGGGFRAYGLYIGPPGFTPTNVSLPYLNRWDDSVWFYDEIPGKPQE